MTMPCLCISGDVGLCTQCELSRLRADLKFFQDSSDEMTAEVLRLRVENAELRHRAAKADVDCCERGVEIERLTDGQLALAEAGDNKDREIERLRAEVTTVTSANARLHDQLEDLDAEVERLRAVCAAQQEAVDNLVNEKNVAIRGRHSAEETQLAPLVELERLRAENAELREGFKVIREMVKEARAEECCCEPGFERACLVCQIDGVLMEQEERANPKPWAGT